MASTKTTSLYEQAMIEKKRRELKNLKADFNPKLQYARQMLKLMPNITLKDKQEQYINAKQFIKWYLGGYKAGKTFIGVHNDIWLAYVNRPYPGLLIHPTADGNKVTIMPAIEEICAMHRIDYKVKYLSTKIIVSFIFGFQKHDWGNLILASGDKPKSLKGPKVAFGHVDEPLVMEKEIEQIIISRVSDKRARLSMVQFTGTPEPKHMKWGFDIVDKEYENSKDRFIITMPTTEVAEYLPDDYIENARKNYTPNEFETFIMGKYRNLSQGMVYENFDSKRNVYKSAEVKPEAFIPEGADVEYVISYDFNVNQMSATLIQLAGRNKTQVKEYRIKNTSDTLELTQLIIARLRQDKFFIKYGSEYRTKYGKSIIISGDASGKNMSTKSKKSDYRIIIDEFDRENIKYTLAVPDSNGAVRDRTNYVNRQFANGTFMISDECPDSIRDRELTSWKLGADGFVIEKSKKELSHLSDAGDYGIVNTQMLTEDADSRNGIEYYERDRGIYRDY